MIADMRWFSLFFVSSLSASVQFVSGPAELRSPSPEALEILLKDDRSVLEWERFDIEPQERVAFVLAQSDHCVLNRVLGEHPSRILGSLTANGTVLLLNPHGILFGELSQIDVGGLIASTLDVHGFDTGEWRFSGASSGSIEHLGAIQAAGDAIFLSQEILNRGSICAEKTVAIGAGSDVVVDLSGERRIALGENTGIFRQSGQIRADRVVALGHRLYLEEGGLIDASKLGGGGSVVFDGARIEVDPMAAIRADALENGNGGNVVAWGRESAAVRGMLSAKGGASGGDGGFVEVSTNGLLDFAWKVDVSAPLGKAGELLLDPTNVLITSGSAGIALSACPALPNVCPTIVNSVDLATFLQTMGSVTISTANGNPCGTGTIDVDPTASGGPSSPVVWTSANTLRLHSNDRIRIFSDILNSGAVGAAGDVILCSIANTIQISAQTGATGTAVAVGSQNGLTQVSAPNADLNLIGLLALIGGGATARPTQLGFRPDVQGLTCTGDIEVDCRNLTMLTSPITGSSTRGSGVRIGHGNDTTADGTDWNLATLDANISVRSRGNILMQTRGTRNHICMIGHGALALGDGAVVPNQDGDITVLCNGSLTMECISTNATRNIRSPWMIGHGNVDSSGGVMPVLTFSGDIAVRTGGDLTMNTGNTDNRCFARIGHNSGTLVTSNAVGDIDIFCGGNLLMTDGPAAQLTNAVSIGHGPNIAGMGVSSLTGSIRMAVNGDVSMIGSDNSIQIGFTNNQVPGDDTTVTGYVELAIRGSLTMRHQGPSLVPTLDQRMNIGYRTATIGPNPVFAAIGGNFNAQITSGSTVVGDAFFMGMYANGDVNLSVGGDIQLTNNGNVTPPTAFKNFIAIGTDNHATGVTRICCGGSLIANSLGGPSPREPVRLGFGDLTNPAPPMPYPAFPFPGASLLIRAGGDIQLPNNFRTTTGQIFIEADTHFFSGELWGYTGSFLSSICSQLLPSTLPSSVSLSPGCFPVATAPCGDSLCFTCPLAAPTANLTGAIATNSFAVPLNGRGGIFVLTDPTLSNNVDLTTTSGNIVLHSGPIFALTNLPADITFGAANSIFLSSTSGNIEVFGTAVPGQCERGDSFRNITLNQALATSGSVLVSANNNLTMTAVSSIATTGMPVTLICDNQFPFMPFLGSGSFNMAAGSSVTTGGGPLSIYTALQNQNAIAGTLNGPLPAAFPGALFQDSQYEVWCTYFCSPLSASPFTVSYKNCLQQATFQAQEIVVEFLLGLHPYNEFPGWEEQFWVRYAPKKFVMSDEPHLLRRRHLNLAHHPKSWTILLPE